MSENTSSSSPCHSRSPVSGNPSGPQMDSTVREEQQSNHPFRFERVELYRDQPLGKGSYGLVIRAQCDELPCAAKLLHPVFFQFADPGSQDAVKRFQRECEVMSAIHHPNIVQCLGSHRDTETGLPVLLMELMDESLTQFLERSQQPLSFHTQVDICHDVALALAYLHSRGMIHRDLSSNNVLMITGSRAKITDFGMSKLLTAHAHLTPLTQCPGCPVFMPPEALLEPPCYTAKLDSFSFGVIALQTITRRFPTPGPRMATVEDPRSPIGVIQIPVSETQRRKADIDRVPGDHLLRPLLLQSLDDSHVRRPTAVELCSQLGGLKESRAYSESRQLARDVAQAAETGELQHLRDLLSEKDVVIRRLREVVGLRQQHVGEEGINNDDHADTPQTESTTATQAQQAKSIPQVATDVSLEAPLASLGQAEQSESLPQVASVVDSEGPLASLGRGRDIRFSSQQLKDSPSGISHGCTAVDGNRAYFSDGHAIIYSYDFEEDSWMKMPKCARKKFGMVVIDGRLTVVGGYPFGPKREPISSLLSLSNPGREECSWTEELPCMRVPRGGPTVAYSHTSKLLVVVGGKESLALKATRSTEVLDVVTKCWFLVSHPLPYRLVNTSCTVCGDSLYILGDEGRVWSARMIVCSLSKLKAQSSEPHSQQEATPIFQGHTWDVVTPPPSYSSTCASVREELLAVGGHSGYQWQPKSEVYRYNHHSNSWEVIGYLPTPRYSTSVASLPGNRLVIAGGYTGLFSMSSTLAEMLQL